MLLILGCALAPGVLYASTPNLPKTALLASVPDSIRLKMLAAMARGDITGAISLWQLHTNRDTVPAALQAMQRAYSVGPSGVTRSSSDSCRLEGHPSWVGK